MRTILITGGAGFIGSCMAEKLIADKDNFIVIVDDLSTGDLKKLPLLPKNNWCFIKCNVNNYRDIAEIMLSYRFDYVFHYAALVGVKRTQENPVKVLDDIHGIENILNLSKNSGVKRILFSSSSEIYGEPVELPQNEYTTPLNSRIPYAIVKNVAEAYLKSYKKEFGIEYTIFRFFNTYGPKQSKDFVMSKFLSLALKNQNITIYGDGTQTRTFCYIEDNIDACFNAFQNNLFINDVVNIGGEIEISILDLANKIVGITGSSSKITHLPQLKEGDMTRRLPDIVKMKKLLKREPIQLKEGITKLLTNLQFISH
ncbi:MAG: epimerase [Bacteroidetes bacterium CG2_30_32_10]|nr:MAG: epimerase [Bacteroidetes bacterium CG2_30_32_10]